MRSQNGILPATLRVDAAAIAAGACSVSGPSNRYEMLDQVFRFPVAFAEASKNTFPGTLNHFFPAPGSSVRT